MKNLKSIKNSPLVLGIVACGTLLMFMSLGINQTSAGTSPSSVNLSQYQADEYCEPLENGDFENGLQPWTVSGEWAIESGRTGQGLSIITPYARQTLVTESAKEYTVTGYYKTEGESTNNWTGIGMDFLNGATELGEESFRITESVPEYTQFEFSGTTPEGTSSIIIWFYSGNGVTLMIDDIEVEWVDCSSELPPTPTPVPPTVTPVPTATSTSTPAPTPTPIPEPPANVEASMIFDEAVSPDWILGSWGVVSRNPLAKEPVFEGVNSLEISLANGFSSVFFEAKEAFPADSLYSVNMALTTVDAEIQTFEVLLYDSAFQVLREDTVVATQGEWSDIKIVYSDLDNADEIRYIVLTNSASSAPFYIDNLFIEHVPVADPISELTETIWLPFVRK